MLEVELPADRLQRSIDESIRRVGRRTRVPGFRPGKVPRPMLERALGVTPGSAGPNPILEEAKDLLFASTLDEALGQSELDVLQVPDPEWLSFAEGTGASYRVTLPVRPQVKLGDYANFPFAPSVSPVDDEKVARVVEQLREQYSSLAPVEARGIENGDWVVISFQGTRDGEPFEGGSAQRYPLVVGRDRMIPGFEENLVGMSQDEEKDFDLTFPEDYPDESLAGKPAHFHVAIREIRQQILPEVDDEFAAQVGPYENLEALRADIRTRLEASAKDRARHDFADRIVEYAVANATLDVPDVMVEQEVEVMHDELRLRLAERGAPYDEYLKATGKDDAAIHEESRGPAEQRVKTLLVLSAVADTEQIEVPDADIEAEVTQARTRYASNPKLVTYFESARGRSYLRSTMRRTRVVETLIDRWLAEHPDLGPLPHLEDSAPPRSPREVDPVAVAAATADTDEEGK